MAVRASGSIFLASALLLAGCGGGGGGGLAPLPPPPTAPTPAPPPTTPTPTPPTAIIPAATTSQQFAAVGAAIPIDGDHSPLLSPDEQLQVRYVAESNSYEVQVPHSQQWVGTAYSSGRAPNLIVYAGNAGLMYLLPGAHQYSRLLSWNNGDNYGYEAIGMATPVGGVPTAGTATYSAQLYGQTSESHPDGTDLPVDGSISLTFDFGMGTLAGSISPNLHQSFPSAALGAIGLRDTVYSRGATAFSGRFDTTLPGVNSFSGLFTGPKAEELIGNWAFPYRSPIDGVTYQTHGAFVGPK